jgi:hypothetical protein
VPIIRDRPIDRRADPRDSSDQRSSIERGGFEMKRFVFLLCAVAIGIGSAAMPAEAGRTTVHKGPRGGKTVVHKGPRGKTIVHKGPRRTVVVHRAFPLRRTLPVVVVRPARAAVRVAPRVFLAPFVWAPLVVVAPAPTLLVWEDGETLDEADDWTEFTLSVNDRGRKMYLQVVSGSAQLNFAEVVFENGDAQVVDFAETTHGAGHYSLLDFKDGRKVDHVRVVARSKSEKARVVLKMAK